MDWYSAAKTFCDRDPLKLLDLKTDSFFERKERAAVQLTRVAFVTWSLYYVIWDV